MDEIEDKDSPYCGECGSCGEVPGCHHPKTCKYLNQHQGEYDDVLKALENAEALIALIEGAVLDRDWQRIEQSIAEYRATA